MSDTRQCAAVKFGCFAYGRCDGECKVAQLVAAEREGCAKIADDMAAEGARLMDAVEAVANDIAAAIRARGSKT